MRDMKDSGIEYVGDIPTHWQIHPIYYYFSERKNKNKLGKEDNLLSLSYGQIIRKNINTSDGLLPESFNTYNIVEKEDIIIRPTDLQNDKNSLRTGLVHEHGIITSAYIAMKKEKKIVEGYFHYLLHSYDVMKVFYNMGNGVRQGLNFSEFSRLLVIEPTIEEQKKITAYLDKKCEEIRLLCNDIQSQISSLEEYKRSVITEAVTKGLNADVEMKDSVIGFGIKIPQHWKEIKTGYLFKENVRPALADDIPLSLSQIDGLIPTDEMKESSLKAASYNNWKHVVKNDLVLNRFKAHLGVMFASQYVGMVSFHYGVYEAQRKLCPKYYEYLYHTYAYRTLFGGMSNGMTVGLQNLSNQNFYSVISLYPPYKEQKEIVEYLSGVISNIDECMKMTKDQLATLEQYKKSLIYEYVTGKKEVPNE